MLDRAHQNMLPEELRRFADDLRVMGQKYAEENGVTAYAEPYAPPDTDDPPAGLAHIMASASRWCSFWASRGHWLEACW